MSVAENASKSTGRKYTFLEMFDNAPLLKWGYRTRVGYVDHYVDESPGRTSLDSIRYLRNVLRKEFKFDGMRRYGRDYGLTELFECIARGKDFRLTLYKDEDNRGIVYMDAEANSESRVREILSQVEKRLRYA